MHADHDGVQTPLRRKRQTGAGLRRPDDGLALSEGEAFRRNLPGTASAGIRRRDMEHFAASACEGARGPEDRLEYDSDPVFRRLIESE